MEEYTKDQLEISAVVGKPFVIRLSANPSTGYQWMPHIDETKLRLLGRRFVLPEAVAIGGGGTEFFTFEPLAEGTTVIRMEYKRAWESTPVQEQVFRVQIDVARF